jgi:hypothetical protein
MPPTNPAVAEILKAEEHHRDGKEVASEFEEEIHRSGSVHDLGAEASLLEEIEH